MRYTLNLTPSTVPYSWEGILNFLFFSFIVKSLDHTSTAPISKAVTQGVDGLPNYLAVIVVVGLRIPKSHRTKLNKEAVFKWVCKHFPQLSPGLSAEKAGKNTHFPFLLGRSLHTFIAAV